MPETADTQTPQPEIVPEAGPAPARARRRPSDLARGVEVIRGHLKTLPVTPGVYRMIAADGAVLYVGKAKNLKRRVFNYTQVNRLPIRLQRMVAET
ncbi:MAG TPA: GIY-YIG nuclease family protein, partial [Azospirillum sp.]|nr:GIY-YIG nuclease family protein [Azospirillum sp.]